MKGARTRFATIMRTTIRILRYRSLTFCLLVTKWFLSRISPVTKQLVKKNVNKGKYSLNACHFSIYPLLVKSNVASTNSDKFGHSPRRGKYWLMKLGTTDEPVRREHARR